MLTFWDRVTFLGNFWKKLGNFLFEHLGQLAVSFYQQLRGESTLGEFDHVLNLKFHFRWGVSKNTVQLLKARNFW